MFILFFLFKGIVHPKMKIMSLFTHPQVVSNLYECIFSAEQQRKIFWRMWETEQFWGTIDFHSIFFLLWKSMVPQNSLVTNFLQNIVLCVQQNKEFIQVWNYLWRVNDDRISFWVNYPFNVWKKKSLNIHKTCRFFTEKETLHGSLFP